MSVLQCLPGLKELVGAISTILPVLLVATISMIKDFFEDNKRRKSDN